MDITRNSPSKHIIIISSPSRRIGMCKGTKEESTSTIKRADDSPVLLQLISTVERAVADVARVKNDSTSSSSSCCESNSADPAVSLPPFQYLPAPTIPPASTFLSPSSNSSPDEIQENKKRTHLMSFPETNDDLLTQTKHTAAAEGSNDTAESGGKRRRHASTKASEVPSHHLHGGSAGHVLHPENIVHHNYHDYAAATAFEDDGINEFDTIDAQIESDGSNKKKKGRGGISSPFPNVLHRMLEHAEREGYSDVVSWQPHGRAFHVHQQDRFVNDIMPKYFRQTR